MKGDREQCLAAGMDGYVSKPIRAEMLFDVLDHVLGDRLTLSAAPDGASIGNGQAADLSAALAAAGGDSQLLLEIVEAYLAECPRIVADIRDAIHRGDAPLLHRAAHTLKGSLNTFAADSAAQFAQRLESMGRQRDSTGAMEAFAELQRALVPVNLMLAELSQNAPSASGKTRTASPVPGVNCDVANPLAR